MCYIILFECLHITLAKSANIMRKFKHFVESHICHYATKAQYTPPTPQHGLKSHTAYSLQCVILNHAVLSNKF